MFRVKVYVGRLILSKHGAQDDGGRLGLVWVLEEDIG